MAEHKLVPPKTEWEEYRRGEFRKRLGRIGYVTIHWAVRHPEGQDPTRGWEAGVLGTRIIQLFPDLERAKLGAEKWATRLLEEAIATI